MVMVVVCYATLLAINITHKIKISNYFYDVLKYFSSSPFSASSSFAILTSFRSPPPPIDYCLNQTLNGLLKTCENKMCRVLA